VPEQRRLAERVRIVLDEDRLVFARRDAGVRFDAACSGQEEKWFLKTGQWDK
jgi:hypothetical protein